MATAEHYRFRGKYPQVSKENPPTFVVSIPSNDTQNTALAAWCGDLISGDFDVLNAKIDRLQGSVDKLISLMEGQ